RWRRATYTAFALDRLNQDAGSVRTDRLLHRLDVAMRHLVEAVHRRTEAIEVFGRAGRGERRQRAAVEGAFEGDDAVAFGMALGGMMLARHLDHAFHRLRAGIAEEDVVGKALLAQPGGELFAVGAPEQVRHVPELGRLLLQRLDEMRMGMAQRVHRDARGEIEIALAIRRDQPGALAALKGEIGPGENGKQVRRGAVGHDGHSDDWASVRRAFAWFDVFGPAAMRA